MFSTQEPSILGATGRPQFSHGSSALIVFVPLERFELSLNGALDQRLYRWATRAESVLLLGAGRTEPMAVVVLAIAMGSAFTVRVATSMPLLANGVGNRNQVQQ